MNPAPRCPRNHPMPHSTSVDCRAGHRHQLHECFARVGQRTCGGYLLVPELGDRCGTPEEVPST